MKILIADDHDIVRKGVIELLRSEFISLDIHEAANGAIALEKINGSIWDLIILDVSMPVKNGIETLKELRASGVKAPILVLSMQPEDQYAIKSLKAGASGFVNKENAVLELVAAVYTVLSGKKHLPSVIANSQDIIKDISGMKFSELLSERELQILQLIVKGKSIINIADEIPLSIGIVSIYKKSILEKLNLSSKEELMRFANDNGLAETN